MAVTLQDGNDWADHAALYDYGFSTYPAKLGASLGQTIQRVQVENGMSATVPLVAADSSGKLLPRRKKRMNPTSEA